MEKIALPWGPDQEIGFRLPEGWRLREVLQPRLGQVPELPAAITEAMRHPIGLPPLHQFAAGKKTAAIVIDDRTRPTPVQRLLPPVVEELEAAGIKPDDVVIVIALGTHRPMTGEGIRERVAAGAVSLLKMLKSFAAILCLTSLPGVPAYQSLGLEFFTESEALLARARELLPRAEVVVLPRAGASFIAWD